MGFEMNLISHARYLLEELIKNKYYQQKYEQNIYFQFSNLKTKQTKFT